MRGRMREGGLKNYFVPAFELNKPIVSGGFAKVVASKNANYTVGEYVAGTLPWQRYLKANPKDLPGLSKPPPVEDVLYYYKYLFALNIAPLSAW